MTMTRILLALFLFAGVHAGAQNNFSQRSGLDPLLQPFYHGVASGDPLHDRVIIWTRVTPDATFVPGDSIMVNWRVATDTGMTNLVNSGVTYAMEARDFCVKMDVTGLSPYTCYYFDFMSYGKYSLRGRTKTAPQGDVDSVRFAVVSCSNYEYGYFHSYKAIKNRNDVDAVLHLGDYIYEYEVGAYSANIPGREHDPVTEIISLSDYRTRYSHYRLDEDLRKVHQQYPFITVWDDHESADNSWMNGAANHDSGTEGPWSTRRSNSEQAYFEWLPVRENPTDQYQLYRSISYGDLLNLYMLDTRLEGRDEQVGATSPDINSPTRSLLGAAQYSWFTSQLTASTAQWNIAGQQVMMAPLRVFGAVVNSDQWDGYAYEREQLLNHVLNNNIENFVVLTGDIHTSWANDIPNGPYDGASGSGSVGAEFVTTSVTSPGFNIPAPSSLIQGQNPHMKYIDLTQKGYMVLDINKNRVHCDWYYVGDVSAAYAGDSHAAAYEMADGTRFIYDAGSQSVRLVPNCTMAPELPIGGASNAINEQAVELLGVYPNPFNDEVLMQLQGISTEHVDVFFYDASGREVIRESIPAINGLNYIRIGTSELNRGMYTIVIHQSGKKAVARIVK